MLNVAVTFYYDDNNKNGFSKHGCCCCCYVQFLCLLLSVGVMMSCVFFHLTYLILCKCLFTVTVWSYVYHMWFYECHVICVHILIMCAGFFACFMFSVSFLFSIDVFLHTVIFLPYCVLIN